MENVISRIYWLGLCCGVYAFSRKYMAKCVHWVAQKREERTFRVEEKLLSADEQKKIAIKIHIFYILFDHKHKHNICGFELLVVGYTNLRYVPAREEKLKTN